MILNSARFLVDYQKVKEMINYFNLMLFSKYDVIKKVNDNIKRDHVKSGVHN
jgi:hypothetical protein